VKKGKRKQSSDLYIQETRQNQYQKKDSTLKEQNYLSDIRKGILTIKGFNKKRGEGKTK